MPKIKKPFFRNGTKDLFLLRLRNKILGFTIFILLVLFFYGGANQYFNALKNIFAVNSIENSLNYYPGACQGNFENPQAAQGAPDVQDQGAIEMFTEENSSYYSGGSKELVCLDFSGQKAESENQTVKNDYIIEESGSSSLPSFIENEVIQDNPAESPFSTTASNTLEKTIGINNYFHFAWAKYFLAAGVKAYSENQERISNFSSVKILLSLGVRYDNKQNDELINLSKKLATPAEEPEENNLFSDANGTASTSQSTGVEQYDNGDDNAPPASIDNTPSDFPEKIDFEAGLEMGQTDDSHSPGVLDSANLSIEESANQADKNPKKGLIKKGIDGALDLLGDIFNFARPDEADAEEASANQAAAKIMYSLDGVIWYELGSIPLASQSNEANNGYFGFEAPFIENIEDLKNLQIKIVGGSKQEAGFVLYVDSIWVGAVEELEIDRLDSMEAESPWKDNLEDKSERRTFSAKEDPVFNFKYKKIKRSAIAAIGEFLHLLDYWKEVKLEIWLTDPSGKKFEAAMPIEYKNNGDFSFKFIRPKNEIRPGKYLLNFSIIDESSGLAENIKSEQEFTWGVMVINADKAVYSTGAIAYLQMASLDGAGNTLCDDEISLEITSPRGNTAILSVNNGLISKNPDCGQNNFITGPDYYAYYNLTETGSYTIKMQREGAGGQEEIYDRIEASDEVPFTIERSAPTRINPLYEYIVKIKITARQDYQGEFIEFVPNSFDISESDYSGHFHETEYNRRGLVWSLDMHSGETREVSYKFDAPDISPFIFLLGQSQVGDFVESRSWQIASDATGVYGYNGGRSAGWNAPGNAWDNIDNFYADRTIPGKSVDDSANYLQATANTSTPITSKITKVEIGVEGYVQTTNITVRAIPIFNNGTATGSPYTIALGTADNNTTVYQDITLDSAGPGIGNWTWAGVANLDIRLYGINTGAPTKILYVDQIRSRVTHDYFPTGQINSVKQKGDGTGVVDFSIEVNDAEATSTARAKIEFATGTVCIAFPGKAYLDPLDANTIADFGDPKIDNGLDYQIGSSTGWITAASGSNTVDFDWLTKQNLPNADGDYCVRLTVNDFLSDQANSATATLTIDNVKPTPPGQLSATSTKAASLWLSFGASTTESHFKEYKIFYKPFDGTPVTELDTPISSSTNPSLGYQNYNNATSTYITGLTASTTYSFNIFAYDLYGNKSSSTQVQVVTNAYPTGVFNSAAERSDGSGIVDISIQVDDPDKSDQCQAKLEYSAGASCLFSPPLKPVLDESDSSASSTYGDAGIDNSGIYQIGTSTGYILTSSGPNTINFDWLSKEDLDLTEGVYCLRLTVFDGLDNQEDPATTTIMIDNKPPTTPGPLSKYETTQYSITLDLGATSTELNFDRYRIYYQPGIAGVTESSTPHLDPDLLNIDFNYTATTTVAGLDPESDYVFNIWAYDLYGNKASSTEVITNTDSKMKNDSLTLANPVSGNIILGDNLFEADFTAVISHTDGYDQIASTTLRLADSSDNILTYNDLEFVWDEASGGFSEIGNDLNEAVSLSQSSTSTCSATLCTVSFRLIFNSDFTLTGTDYNSELFSVGDNGKTDWDIYYNIYQVRTVRLNQVHYRWRNDDGLE